MVNAVLLLGQSNMSGRGDPADVEPIVDARIKVLRNGRWQKMFVPVHFERKSCGICLAESFAKTYIEEHTDENEEIGLIPCADGGSSISMWQPGELLYDHAVMQAKLAQRTSNIVAILWHQGESDCPPGKYPLYEEKFLNTVRSLRRDLNLPEVPFIVGGIGAFIANFVSKTKGAVYGGYVHINAALQKVVAEEPNMAFVSAEGLNHRGDSLHFDAQSLREFGLRYYDAFRKMENKTAACEKKSDTTEHTELEEF